MRRFTLVLFLGMTTMIFYSGCKSRSHIAESQKAVKVTGPQVVIYKTKDNYYLQVPVNLSPDKKTLVSYPAPSDIYNNGKLSLPVKLENGYLLDQRGIGGGCAFLKWTYYEYSRLDHTPSSTEIMKMILEDDPLTELYYCGRKSGFRDLESELNQAIRDGKLDKFKRIK